MIAFKAIAAIALSVAFGSWTYFPWAASANSLPNPLAINFLSVSITNRISQLLKETNQENLIENVVNSIDQFDTTQENLDELIFLSKQELQRVKPLIKEMTIAANHLNNILSTINDKETLNDIKLTINAARSISTKIDDMSDDFEKLTQDKELTKSIRDLTIGLSKFLNEIYP